MKIKVFLSSFKMRLFYPIVLGFTWFITSSQGGIVYDPTNAITLSSILKSSEELKELQSKAVSNKDFLDKIMNEGKEVKRFMSLMETMFCAMDEFNIYIGVVGELTLCNRRMEMDMTLSRIDGLSGKMKAVGVGVYAMSQFEAISSIKDLNDELEKGIREIQSINTNLKKDVITSLNSGASEIKGKTKVSWGSGSNI